MDGISPSSSASNAMPNGMVYCAAPEFPPVDKLVDGGMAASDCADLLRSYYLAYGKYVGVVAGEGSGSEVSVRSGRRGKRGSGLTRTTSSVLSGSTGVGSVITGPDYGLLSDVVTFRDLAKVAACDVDDALIRGAFVTRVRPGEYHLAKHGVSLLSVLGALCINSGLSWPPASVGSKYAKSCDVVLDELINVDCVLGGSANLIHDPGLRADLHVTICAGDRDEQHSVVALIKKKTGVVHGRHDSYADRLTVECGDLSLVSACLGTGYRLWHQGAYVFAVPAYKIRDGDLGFDCMPGIPGLCYLSVIMPDCRCEAVFTMGFDITVERLLSVDAGWVVDRKDLLRVGVFANGAWHMYADYDGPYELSALGRLLGVVRLIGRGSDGSLSEMLYDGYSTTLPDIPVAGREVLQYCVGAEGAAFIVSSQVTVFPVGSKETFESDIYFAMRAQAMLDSAGKDRLRVLAGVGDAALTLYVATACLSARTSAQAYQELRSSVTKNEALAALFRSSSLPAFFLCVGEITAKVGGEAMEAVLGAVYRCYGMPGLAQVLVWFGFRFGLEIGA